MKKNNTLTHLWIDKNDLKTKSTIYLTNALNHAFHFLSMNSCNLDDEASAALGEGLSWNKYLKVLLLQNNDIRNEGAKAFAEVFMRHNIVI